MFVFNQTASDRYSRVVEWAKKRYTVNGLLTIEVGGKPAVYKRIEIAAWNRYLRECTK